MRSRAARLAATALLVVWSVGILGVVPGPAAGATEQGVLLEVNIQETGDAIWTVTARYQLTTTNETAAFDQVIDDYLAGEPVGPQTTPFEELAARGENRTGRPMAIQGINRSGEILNRSQAGPDTPGDATGILVLQFRWTGFADTGGDEIRLGDVFGGNWDLSADQTLVIRPPSGYSVDTVRPSTSVDGGVLRWEGPQAFGENEPAVVYLTSNSVPRENGRSLILIIGYIVGVGIALVGGGLAVYTWVRRDDIFSDDGLLPIGGDTTDTEPPTIHTDPDTTEPPLDTTQPPDPDEGPTAVDPELLSDEERVERLLEHNGGRMKQADIVSETDWSNAKVSQLLTAMADEGRIEKLRIGRENLITLAEDDMPDEEE